MKSMLTWAAVMVLVVAGASVAEAGKVSVRGTHLCCGACQTAAVKALKGLKGVTATSVDRNAKVITFTAGDAKAVQTGILALSKAGFYGTTTHGKQKVAFPVSGAKRGERSDKVKLLGMHLCCDACVIGAQKALENVRGVSSIEIDRKLKTVRLIGKGISVPGSVAALNKAGYFCRVARPKKTPKE